MKRGAVKAGLAAALAGVLGLGACGSEVPRVVPCPRVAVLREGADLTRFRPGAGQDLSVMLVDARIIGVDAPSCSFADRGRSVVVEVAPRFAAEQGPASSGAPVELPWLVAVSDARDTRVIDRQEFVTRMVFPANMSRAQVSGRSVRLVLPNSPDLGAEEYNVRIAFRLSEEELAYNRRRGAR